MNILTFLILMFGFFLLLTYVSSLKLGFSSDDLALVLFLGLYSLLLTVNSQSITTVIAVLIPISIAAVSYTHLQMRDTYILRHL